MLKGKKIVIIHPGNPRFDFRLKKTVDILSRAGVQVVVLAYLSKPENDVTGWNCESACTPRPFTMFKASENKLWLLRVLWNLTVLKVQLFFERQVDVCEGLAKRALALRPDLVYCIGIETVEEAHKILQKSNLPLIYEAYEYYPSLLKENLYFTTRSKNRRYCSLEKQLLQSSRVRGIVVGEEIAEGYVGHYACRLPEVIHNVAPNKIDAAQEHKRPLRFYFQSYLRPTYNIENLIEVFAQLKSDSTLTIQGNAHEEGYFESLEQYIEELGASERVSLIAACPYEKAVEEASKYDVGLISLSANWPGGFNENVFFALQNKLFTYAAAGLAILAADYPAQAAKIKQYNCGITYNPDASESLIQAIHFCIEHYEKVFEMRQNSLLLANDYSFEKEGEKLLSLCKGALEISKS